MKAQKKPRNSVIACSFILALLIIDIVTLFTGRHMEVYEWLLHAGILLSLLQLVYTDLLLPRKLRTETEGKKKAPSLRDMGYPTITCMLFTPAMVISCLTPEAPLPVKALCMFATICAVWAWVSGWVKYCRKIP